jgi:hypothetical protein
MPPAGTISDDYRVSLASKDEVFRNWSGVAAMIQAALNVGELTLEQIKSGIDAGTVVVILVTKGQELTALGTLQIIDTQFRGEFRRMLNVITATGYAIERARGPVVAFLEELARSEGCDGIMLKGRKGWTGKMRPFGFRVEYTVMAKMV